MLLDRFRVQPNEKRKFTIDYSDRLQNGNLLTSVGGVVIDPVTTVPFMIGASVHPDGDKVVLYTQGGETMENYQMDILVNTTDAGQCWEDEIIFMCEEI